MSVLAGKNRHMNDFADPLFSFGPIANPDAQRRAERIVGEVARLAKKPMPRVYLSPGWNAGVNDESGDVVLGIDLLDRVSDRGIKGATGHEFGHLAQPRLKALQRIVMLPAFRSSPARRFVSDQLYSAVERYAELDADKYSAKLLGDPGAQAEALRTMGPYDPPPKGFKARLHVARDTLTLDHPYTYKRIARLERMKPRPVSPGVA
jgi:Zn-dependent protease with chaperone function